MHYYVLIGSMAQQSTSLEPCFSALPSPCKLPMILQDDSRLLTHITQSIGSCYLSKLEGSSHYKMLCPLQCKSVFRAIEALTHLCTRQLDAVISNEPFKSFIRDGGR